MEGKKPDGVVVGGVVVGGVVVGVGVAAVLSIFYVLIIADIYSLNF